MIRKTQQLIVALLLAGLALALMLSPTRADSPPIFLLMWGFEVNTGTGSAFEICTAETTPCFAGESGNAVGQFSFPTGVAVDSSGNVYVADTTNNRIQKFDGNGGSGTELVSGLFLPFDVAVDSTGTIYVADFGNSRIQKFDSSSGNDLGSLATSGSGNGDVSTPLGVAVDQDDNVYVADTGNNRIQKFNSSGVFQWAEAGSGDNQFNQPAAVAVDSAGNIYVADTNNNRIQKRNSNGDFLAKWGTFGPGIGQFNSPSGIAVDKAGNVYVADTSNHRIQKFNSNGDLATLWGSIGSGENEFFEPADLAFDSAGNVYVADGLNNRIQKFRLPPLSLIKTVNNDNPNPGQRITYTITVDNNDTVTANNAVISDTLPGELTLAGAATLEGSSGSVAIDAGDLPTLASGLTIGVGQRITVTFPVTVNTGLPANTVITNTAAVTSTEVITPQTGSALITTNPVNLTLIKAVSTNIPNPGERITYTITVNNNGLNDATGAVISDTLPDGLTFAGPVGLAGSSGNVAQDAGDLPALASGLTIAADTGITVTFPVTVNTGQDNGTIIINTAAVTSAEVTSPQSDPELIILFDTISPTFPITNPLTGSPLLTPTLSVILDTARPIFEWYAAWDNGQTLTYFLTLSDTLGGLSTQSSVSFTTTQTSFTPTTNLPNGDYTWTVQAQDAAGNVNTLVIPPESFTIAADSSTIYLPVVLKNE